MGPVVSGFFVILSEKGNIVWKYSLVVKVLTFLKHLTNIHESNT